MRSLSNFSLVVDNGHKKIILIDSRFGKGMKARLRLGPVILILVKTIEKYRLCRLCLCFQAHMYSGKKMYCIETNYVCKDHEPAKLAEALPMLLNISNMQNMQEDKAVKVIIVICTLVA
jgi:hypothetical protein